MADLPAIDPVLVGLNGWHRYSHWTAHFYVDGRQQCNTVHGNFNSATMTPRRPEPTLLSRHGEPFGRACSRCLRAARRASTQRPAEVK